MHVTGTENQITCTPAIQWLTKVYVNGLLIYNVPHLLSLWVYNCRFSVDWKWLRTAAELLGCNTLQHCTEMWLNCTVAIRLVRQLDLICLLVSYVPHAHSTGVYRKRVHIGRKWWKNAAESLHLHKCMFPLLTRVVNYSCVCKRHWISDNMHACHSVTDESIRKRTADL